MKPNTGFARLMAPNGAVGADVPRHRNFDGELVTGAR
jgi:hypothetical protein